MLWVLLAVVVLLWVLQRRWSMRRLTALANQLKTNLKAYPIIGHSYMFMGNNEDRMRGIEELGRDVIAVGGISKCYVFNQLMLCVADPVIADAVLDQCLEKHNVVKILSFLIGDATIAASVKKWRPRRKLNASVFKTKNLVQFTEMLVEHSTVLAELFEKEVDKGTFSCWEYLESYGMNSVSEFVMGVNICAKENQFSHAVEELWEIGTCYICKPWLHMVVPFFPIYEKVCQYDSTMGSLLQRLMPFMTLYKKARNYKITVWNYIKKTVEEKRGIIKTDSEEARYRSSFLELQLRASENARRFTEQELFEELILLIGAGYDTTATAGAFVLLMMGRHAVIQDKVYEELKCVFGESNRPAVYEDLAQLKYLVAVIKETLRLYPTAPVIARTISEDVNLPSNITLIKDCGILINIWAVHRNPEYWGPDADQFRPERFLDYTPKHPAAFMPFSHGARNCIGYRFAMMSLKTMLCTLLRRFEFVAPPGVAQGDPARTSFKILLKHVDKYETQIKRRLYP